MATSSDSYAINRTDLILTGSFTEADIELAKLAFKAIAVELRNT